MVNLIRNRTSYDVYLLDRLRSKGWDNMTASEQNLWRNSPKGAYNYTDLNRVESTVNELAYIYELNLTTKTNWTRWDIPTRADMERYLANVAAIRDKFSATVAMPEVPKSMSGLTYDKANDIEEIRYRACLMTEEILSGISVVYTGGEITVGTPLSELTGITVTATWSDGSSEVVTAYTLVGEIAEGENTITVQYGIRSATFTVVGRVPSSTLGRAILGKMVLGAEE